MMDKLKLALMAAGAWWVWTQIGSYLPQGAGVDVPRDEPRSADPTRQPQPDDDGKLISMALGNINREWADILGSRYAKPRLVLYTGQTQGCGGQPAEAQAGPFYVPECKTIYVPTSLFHELEQRGGCHGAPCKFVAATVIGHEIGHHVENQLGLLRGGGGPQLELMADCLSGVWAAHENARLKGALVEAGDVEAALRWLNSIGGQSHGSGAQRQQAFNTGLRGGTLAACNTSWRGGAS